MGMPASEWILDETRLNGAGAIKRVVGPNQDVLLVNGEDLPGLELAISHLCQIWGGAKYPLIPVSSTGQVPAEWQDLLTLPQARVFTGSVGSCDPAPPEKPVDGLPAWTAKPLVAVLAGGLENDPPRGSIRVSLPEPDSPWYVGYLATLGALPESPDPSLLESGNLVDTLAFSDMVRLERETISTPLASDLMDRLRDHAYGPPSRASMWHLAPVPAPWRTSIKQELTDARPVAARTGPNIAVVYEAGSIADACLIWTLRAIHGTPEGLPLGIPVEAAADAEDWLDAQSLPALIGGQPRLTLTSLSVPLAQLEAIASQHDNWSVASAADLLQVPPPAVRPSSEVAVFEAGVARVQALSFGDQEFLRRVPSRGPLSIRARFELANRALPPIRSLEHESFMSGFSRGGWETVPRRLDQVEEIQWPSGWLVLQRAVRDRGLRLRPSTPGRAALSLLERMGGLGATEKILSRPLIDRLYQLCERRGISWFRARVRELGEATSGAAASEVLERIDNHLEALTFRPFEDEQTVAGFGDFKKDLANERDAARAWVPWAERNGLLVRGADVQCDQCGSRHWRAVGEFNPGMVCRSCGAVIGQPFDPSQLVFRYRASEALLTAVEFDVIPHVLALRWFWRLLEPSFDRGSDLYGGHPGVELLRADGKVIAEIDVLLLMADGSLVPGEVKRNGVGLQTTDLDKLDMVCEALGSPWSFVGTPDWSANCPQIWKDAIRDAPEPRMVLTGEQMLSDRVFWALGTDPFAWTAETDDEHVARTQAFAKRLREILEWEESSRVPGRFDWPEAGDGAPADSDR